jgi:hypothetical protein
MLDFEMLVELLACSIDPSKRPTEGEREARPPKARILKSFNAVSPRCFWFPIHHNRTPGMKKITIHTVTTKRITPHTIISLRK